jgi:integrin-linked kinase-associated serine/threonine phosphatase 2C
VLLACDGLWKSFSNEEAVKLVSDTFRQSRDESDYEACCEQLAVEAVKRLSADNVTVLVVAFTSLI